MPRRRLLRTAGYWAAGVALLLVGALIGSWWQQGSDGVEVTLSKTDIAFARDMSAHHAQALLLAQTLPRDVDPQVRMLADQIVTAQSAEIATMQGWLTLADQPLSAPAGDAGTHHGHDGQHDIAAHDAGQNGAAPMPGMASIAEISALGQARGGAAEVLFLQLMVRHHNGGVVMAQAAYQDGLSGPVSRTALAMIRDQVGEVGQMSALLAARNVAPLPFP
ncbi:DUF305 domain-containing protein [Aldersonia sp. NBC_00410]|uniref:DUF305 domain-containing protein n=1 Tax=Aldersonia sp. NBC_00410 TaxID=2975954 RepID=UPI00224CC90F|nr:DUF305 domain-containing protein [Aldersonia sp. NBC_00410]MCX5044609.1 DUF305 domain-containing protein [Aldersonia sp. NBC_00410]